MLPGLFDEGVAVDDSACGTAERTTVVVIETDDGLGLEDVGIEADVREEDGVAADVIKTAVVEVATGDTTLEEDATVDDVVVEEVEVAAAAETL